MKIPYLTVLLVLYPTTTTLQGALQGALDNPHIVSETNGLCQSRRVSTTSSNGMPQRFVISQAWGSAQIGEEDNSSGIDQNMESDEGKDAVLHSTDNSE